VGLENGEEFGVKLDDERMGRRWRVEGRGFGIGHQNLSATKIALAS
jgi:hypothetical protein